MEQTFKLEIITPYRVFFTGTSVKLIVTSIDGDLEILAHHENVVATVSIGLVKIQQDTVWKTASVSDGFLEVQGNKVTVLVGAAEWPEEIDVERAERSLVRASERLKKPLLPVEIQRAEKAAQRAKIRMKIAFPKADKKD